MTSLLLSAKRLPDGRVVLTNSKGEELPMQVVPTKPMETMIDGYCNTHEFAATWRNALSVASVDVSEAVVEIPQ